MILSPEDIYNWDKSWSIFQAFDLHFKNRGMSVEPSATFVVYPNATGTHKIPLAMIGKSAKPQYFQACPVLGMMEILPSGGSKMSSLLK